MEERNCFSRTLPRKIGVDLQKGDTSKAENYRPISLLSSLYKIYMIMIRSRIQEEVEKAISCTQYAFRLAKSTAHAIYIIRRIQDYVEKNGEPLFMDHECLCDALERMGIDPKVIKVLKDGYDKTTFYVEDNSGNRIRKKPVLWDETGLPIIVISVCGGNDVH